MSDGLNFPKKSGIEAFDYAFNQYLQYNTREQGMLIEDRGRKVRFELMKEFAAIAETPSGLRSALEQLGYKFRRRKGANGRTLTPEQEIRARIASRKFLSASFIFKQWGRGPRQINEGGTTGKFLALSKTQKRIGEAVLKTSKGETKPFVSITSYLDGAIVQSRQRGILDRVLYRQAIDMGNYIARKHSEYLANRLIGDFSITVNV